MQHDQLEGFSELLAAAGAALSWGEHSFTALITTLQPKVESFDLTPGDDAAVSVRALRSVFPDALPAIGEHFEDEFGTGYRITRVIPAPGNLIMSFECEVLHHVA